jgi:uncharacterized protein YodC (DUF2158 family)
MSERPIQEGELVALKSGGPYMAVTQVHDRSIECMWFDEKGVLQERSFPVSVLVRQEDEKGVSGS